MGGLLGGGGARVGRQMLTLCGVAIICLCMGVSCHFVIPSSSPGLCPTPSLTTTVTFCLRCCDGPLDPPSPRPSGTNLQRSSETLRNCSRPRPGAIQGPLQASGSRWTVPLPPHSPPWPSHRSCRQPWLCSRPSHCTSPRRDMGEVRPCACRGMGVRAAMHVHL